MARIRSPNPRTLIHGHPPLTEFFTMDALRGFEAALRDVHKRILAGIGEQPFLVQLVWPESRQIPATLRGRRRPAA